MKRKILSRRFGALLAALAAGACPAAHRGAGGGWISPIDLSQAAGDQQGPGWSWQNETKVLTLQNCNLTFQADGFTLPADSTVAVTGENTITAYDSYQIFTVGSTAQDAPPSPSLTITGDGRENSSLHLIHRQEGRYTHQQYSGHFAGHGQ